VPGLLLGIALRAAALEIDRKADYAVRQPSGHGSDKLVGIALGVPYARVGVGPALNGLWVAVVEDTLDHARVGEQAFDFVAVPVAALVGRVVVDMEGVGVDGDGGF
jgi:hypothetical protein